MDEFSKAANEINRILRTEQAKDEAKADPYQDAKNALYSLEAALLTLQAAKPGERGELARRYAVTITEMEKVVAYFKMYVVDGDDISTYYSTDDQVRSGYEDAKIDSPCGPLD